MERKTRPLTTSLFKGFLFVAFLGWVVFFLRSGGHRSVIVPIVGSTETGHFTPDREVPVPAADLAGVSSAKVLSGGIGAVKYTGEGFGGFPENPAWDAPSLVVSPHKVTYFDREKLLPMLTNRIAVKHVDISRESSLITGSMEDAGFREDDLKAFPIQGWALASTEHIDSRVDGAVVRIGNLVRDLAAKDTEIAFVSPVFIDPEAGGRLIVTPMVLVGFAEEVTTERRREALDSVAAISSALVDIQVSFESPYLKIPLPAFRDAFSVLEVANALASHPDVLFAEPDMIFEGQGALIPNDPQFSSLWGLRNTGQLGGLSDFDMDVEEAWDITTGSPSVKVLIIDTGVQQDHPDINQLPGRDFTSESASNPNGGPVNDLDRHGTPVAGAVSALMNNGVGSAGVAPGVKSISARCFISNSSTSWTGSFSWTADALDWAATQGVRVTNNSNRYGGTSAAVAAAYDSTKSNGMIHFASAGNDAVSSLSYPSSLVSVNAVAASNRSGGRASFSQWGTGLAFTAPGEAIILPDRTGAVGYSAGDTATLNGTSFASPYAAGVAALLVSLAPTLTSSEIESYMEQTCLDLGTAGYDTNYGWGHVNARAALLAADSGLDDAYEPNNTRAAPYDFSSAAGQWLDTIAGPGRHRDDDWYRIVVPSGKTRVKAECLFTETAGNVDLSLVDNAGGIVFTAASATGNESIDVIVPAPGTYYLRVYGAGNTGKVYNLRWETLTTPVLDLSAGGASFTVDGGTFEITVTSNGPWNWSKPSGAIWVSTTEAISQSGTQTFSGTVAPNTSLTARTVDLTFLNGFQTVVYTIAQEGVPPVLDIDSISRNVDYLGGARAFNVTSNTVWTWSRAGSNPWLVVVEAPSQNGNQAFSYAVTSNQLRAPRMAEIILTNGVQTRTHTIVQGGVVPGIPTNLVATRTSGNAIDLKWSAPIFAAEYEVWRGSGPSLATMERIATTSAIQFTDEEVLTGETKYYHIIARNENGTGVASQQTDEKVFGNVDVMATAPGGSTFYGADTFFPAPASIVFKTRRTGVQSFGIAVENESETGAELVNCTASGGSSRFQTSYVSPVFGNVSANLALGNFASEIPAGGKIAITAMVKPKGKGAKSRGTVSLNLRAHFQSFPEKLDAVSMTLQKLK